jgi:hypothetical protein
MIALLPKAQPTACTAHPIETAKMAITWIRIPGEFLIFDGSASTGPNPAGLHPAIVPSAFYSSIRITS